MKITEHYGRVFNKYGITHILIYKDTNYSIKKQMGNNEYYCINFDESLNNRLRSYFVENVGESSGVGKWFKYYYVKNLNLQDNQIVKKIYESNYGPLFEI